MFYGSYREGNLARDRSASSPKLRFNVGFGEGDLRLAGVPTTEESGIPYFGASTVTLMLEYHSATFSISASVSDLAMMFIWASWRLPAR